MKTIDEQIKCVERELAMRRSVYPKRVHKGLMTQAQADHETGAMTAVLESLQKRKEAQADVRFLMANEGHTDFVRRLEKVLR